MHAILVTVGTDGDIFPYAALGSMLRARASGHAGDERAVPSPGDASRPRLPPRPCSPRKRPGRPLTDPDFLAPPQGWGDRGADGSRRSFSGNTRCSTNCQATRMPFARVKPGRRLRPARSGNAGEAHGDTRPPAWVDLKHFRPAHHARSSPFLAGHPVGARKLVLAPGRSTRAGWVVGQHLNRVRATLRPLQPVGAAFLQVVVFARSHHRDVSGRSRPAAERLAAADQADRLPIVRRSQPGGGLLPPEILHFCLEGASAGRLHVRHGDDARTLQIRSAKAVEVCRLLGKPLGDLLDEVRAPASLPRSRRSCGAFRVRPISPALSAVCGGSASRGNWDRREGGSRPGPLN